MRGFFVYINKQYMAILVNMKKYVLIHEHQYGVDNHYFQSDSNLDSLLRNIESVFEILEVDFEESKGESYTLTELPTELKTVIL